jgi:hypothetical protein
MGELASEYDDYDYGDDYINLGYIPGGAVGLQAFAAAPWNLFSGADYVGSAPTARDAPAAAGLTHTLADVNIVLIFTADRNGLVGWIEQVGQLPGMEKVKMVAGVSAGLEPWARPYYQSDPMQLDGLVSGVRGAAQYELRVDQHQATQQADGAINLRDSQMVGLVVIILFLAIGLLWGIGYGLVDRRRGDG